MRLISRRVFSGAGGAALAVLAAGGARKSGAAPAAARPMRLGGPVFVKSTDPGAQAQAHLDLGYRAAYAPNDLTVQDRDRVAAIVKEFAKRDVVIAEVGAWKNMLDPDGEKRRANLTYVTERLALAEALGARNCVDIAGSFNPSVWFGQDPRNLSTAFFDATVENCRKVIDGVKPARAKFTIEMMPWSLPSTPADYVKLIRAVDRKAFGVHLDVCNTMSSPGRLYKNAEVIEECFRVLGQWIVSCHAKDLQWGPGYQVNIQEVIPGTGVIDYKTYLRELSKLPVDAPLMLEHLHGEEEYTKGRQYIQGVAKSLELSFGVPA
ncbi:MAG TPA: sugar phosphate isomerase/epimerase [Bryobacteraceae bacterium]|nr:sugar phosphate isomerase/epimerase [Bryobacteraceae bacterium]